jgi:hypothetical protein
MTSKIAIIGGGWYGCHVATSLAALGFEVRLFEQHNRLLHEASGNNQFRLHLGFHYARHHGTRIQSRDGYSRFMERYSGLSREIAENIYAVPHEDSLIDWQTYKLVMTSTGLNYREVSPTAAGLTRMDGVMMVDERVLLIERSRNYFKALLGDSLSLGTRVDSVMDHGTYVEVDGEKYDFVVDATWGHHKKLPIKTFYEPTLLLYYEGDVNLPAITMVDGPLCSVYPTEDPNIYTLSSVPHTPLGTCETAQEARQRRDEVNGELVRAKVDLMETQVSKYLPDFKSRYKFMGPQLAIKTKPVGAFDDRSCGVYRDGRIFNVMSGKIDTIFVASERIISFIQSFSTQQAEDDFSTLKQNILSLKV